MGKALCACGTTAIIDYASKGESEHSFEIMNELSFVRREGSPMGGLQGRYARAGSARAPPTPLAG